MKNKQKVLILCAAFPPRGKGGGPLSSYQFSKALSDKYEVKVVTVGEQAIQEVYDGVPVSVIKSPNIYWDYLHKQYSGIKKIVWHILENFNPIAYFRIKKEIKSFNPEAVVTISIENINVATWLAAKHLKKPILHVLHSYFIFCYKGGFFKHNQNCQKQCLDCKALSVGKVALSKKVDMVMGETDFVVDEHVRQGLFKNIPRVKIPSPVVINYDKPPKRRNGSLKVGYMGVLEPHKGLDVLANAAQQIGFDNSIEFLIAGTSRDDDYLTKITEKFDQANSHFLGWVKPEEVYPLFDVLVVSSIWKEPFGRIVAEAMSYGIPVIAARSGGVQENIIDGENGFLYEAHDVHALVSSIQKISLDEGLRYRMALNAKSYSKEFDYHLYQKRLENCLDAFINKNNVGRTGS